MRLFTALFSLAIFVAADDCKYALEVLLLQDGSTSFAKQVDAMIGFMTGLIDTLIEEYGEFKFGISSFVDKPIPIRGGGPYGAYTTNFDYCYRSHSALTEKSGDAVTGLQELKGNLGWGNDFPENPFEALILAAADSEMDWSPADQAYSATGRPIVRLVLLITDDIPHLPTEGPGAISAWNYPRSYTEGSEVSSSGGFGSLALLNIKGALNQDPPELIDQYTAMAGLFGKLDHNKTLTTEEEAQLDTFIDLFGPYPYTELVANPGDGSIDCALADYPSAEQAGAMLKSKNILPIFLLADPSSYGKEQTKACNAIGLSAGKDCLVKLYENYAAQMGVMSVVDSIDGANTEERILNSIRAMTAQICLAPTTTTLPTTAFTAKDSPHIVIPPTVPAMLQTTKTALPVTTKVHETTKQAVHETSAVQPTSAIAHDTTQPRPTVEATKPATTGGALKSTAGAQGVTSVQATSGTAETSEEAIVVPPVVPVEEGGSSVGVIAGASAGAVAGVAAVAGVLYAKFGGAMFGGSSGAGFDAVQQVETPDSPIERETMEQVTMEMFQ